MKTRFLIILLCMFAVLCASIPKPLYCWDRSAKKEAQQLIDRGKNHFDSKEYHTAIELWTEALVKDPWNDEAQQYIEQALSIISELSALLDSGFELLEVGRLAEAEIAFNTVAVKSNPKDLEIQTRLEEGLRLLEQKQNQERSRKYIREGDNFVASSNFSDALKSYSFAYELDPENSDILKKLEYARGLKSRADLRDEALAHFNGESYETSRNLWTMILDDDPANEEAQLYLSKIAFKIRNGERTEALARSYFENGKSFYQKGHLTDAIDQFENAVALNYLRPESEAYIIEIRELQASYSEEVVVQKTDRVTSLLREGIKLYNLEQYERSLSVLNEGLKIDPENIQIREYMVRDMVAIKREEEKHVPQDSPFFKLVQDLTRLGNEAYMRGEYHLSATFWEEILLIYPNNEEARINLIRVMQKTDPSLARDIVQNLYLEAGELERSGQSYQALTKIDIILGIDVNHTGALQMRERLDREQRTVQRNNIDEASRKSISLYKRGLTLYSQDRLEEAVDTLQKALTEDDENIEARIALSRAETKIRLLAGQAAVHPQNNSGIPDEMQITLKRHFIEGMQYYMDGMYREAIDEWESVLRIDPDHVDAQVNIGHAQRRLADIAEREPKGP